MTFKVIGFKEYVYICISLHSDGLKVLRGKKKKESIKGKRPNHLAVGCGPSPSFEAL